MNAPLRVLLIEDDFYDAELLAYAFKNEGIPYQLKRVTSAIELRGVLTEFIPQVVICDFSLPGFDGFEALEITNSVYPRTPFLFSSGTIGQERAQLAMERGAMGYARKGDYGSLFAQIRDCVNISAVS